MRPPGKHNRAVRRPAVSPACLKYRDSLCLTTVRHRYVGHRFQPEPRRTRTSEPGAGSKHPVGECTGPEPDAAATCLGRPDPGCGHAGSGLTNHGDVGPRLEL